MSNTLDPRFIDAVKAGKIEGVEHSPYKIGNRTDEIITVDGLGISDSFSGWVVSTALADHLCAHLRRWINGRRCDCILTSTSLRVAYAHPFARPVFHHCKDGTELDWHIAAVLWVLEQEESNA